MCCAVLMHVCVQVWESRHRKRNAAGAGESRVAGAWRHHSAAVCNMPQTTTARLVVTSQLDM